MEKQIVKIDVHIFITKFPSSQESYDAYVDDYISKLDVIPPHEL